MNSPVHVILLNGVSSVGKSSVAKALQRLATQPFLYVAMDHFLDMLPPRTLNHPDGITFEVMKDAENPTIAVRTGVVADRALTGMRHAIAALAAQGNHIIVDDVMFGSGEEREYRALLGPFYFRLVGVFAPLAVIEARERRRGDREIGLARWQFDIVHRGRVYDLEVDTSSATPDEIAERIRDTFGL
jgi:chloramphenicol 3-O phosphotransferase